MFLYFLGECVGLFGNHDGLSHNDLVSRSGELISYNASMIDIHNRFGLTCKYILIVCYSFCV